MPITRQEFVERYVAAMSDRNAALFIGAGLSCSAGFVDWRSLMSSCARELGLNVTLEHDLVAVAQYYLNLHLGNRARLNQILIDYFAQEGALTENHELIASLPISTVWTTNFDTLIEDAYKTAGRQCDVKTSDKSVTTTRKGRDVTLYKMHGDIARPDEIVICKDDYERYALRHRVFQETLEADLINKTFLFLGFSFQDPNLNYMLGHLRTLLENNTREHYAIMRAVARSDYERNREGDQRYDYDSKREGLLVRDLKRYGIRGVLICDYAEIPDILRQLARRYRQQSVFVSGSASQFGSFGEDKLRGLCWRLGRRLMDEGYNLVNGFGVNVGSEVILGAVSRLAQAKEVASPDRLVLRPFPHRKWSNRERKAFAQQYRRDMIGRTGFTLFVAGNKAGRNVSPGVIEEFEITKAQSSFPIPIGATGFAAKHIWQLIKPEIQHTYSGRISDDLFHALNDTSLSLDQLVDAVFRVMDGLKGS